MASKIVPAWRTLDRSKSVPDMEGVEKKEIILVQVLQDLKFQKSEWVNTTKAAQREFQNFQWVIFNKVVHFLCLVEVDEKLFIFHATKC